MRYSICAACALLLGVVTPLLSQQTVVVPNVDVTVNGDTIVVIVNVEVPPPDSAQVAAAIRAEEAIARYFEECGCTQQSTSTVVRIGQSAIIAILGFAAWQLKKIADRPSGDDIHNEGDTNVDVDVTLPPHIHKSDKSGKSDR